MVDQKRDFVQTVARGWEKAHTMITYLVKNLNLKERKRKVSSVLHTTMHTASFLLLQAQAQSSVFFTYEDLTKA